MSVDSKLLSLFSFSDTVCSLHRGRGKCLHSLWVNIGLTVYLVITFSGSDFHKPPNRLSHITAFVLSGLGCFLLSWLLYRGTRNALWCHVFEVRTVSCSSFRYVVLPRPVCFEKGLNYTIRLELSQYSSVDTETENPYTLIDSVSRIYFRDALKSLEVCIFPGMCLCKFKVVFCSVVPYSWSLISIEQCNAA